MRSAFDKFISWTGLLMAIVLLVAGSLLWWAHTFIGDQVDDQLTMQGITMPEGEALSSLPKADADALKEFAGSPLDTGPEARAFADHYILVHMNGASATEDAPDGRTYEEVSGEYISMTPEQQATEEGQALAGLRQTLFMGNTLRGLLLYGYAFATMGTIAGIAALVSFAGSIVLFILFGLGIWHGRKMEKEAKAGAVAAGAAPQPV